MKINDVPAIGLYRHFKGGFYLLMNILRSDDGSYYAQYVNIMHPEQGYFVRPTSEWNTDVSSREDNFTGQKERFTKVYSVMDDAKNLSTEHLIRELRGRKDSPLQDLDIEGLNDHVFCTDYCIGEAYEAHDEYPNGVNSLYACESMEEAVEAIKKGKHFGDRCKIFKRVFIEQ